MKAYPGYIVTFDASQRSMTDGFVTKPHFHTGDNMDAVCSVAEYAQFVDSAKREPGLQRFLMSESPGQPELWYSLYPLLAKALVPTFIYDAARLDDLLNQLNEDISRTSVRYSARIFFRELQPSLGRPMNFGQGVIRPIPPAEIVELVNASDALSSGMSAQTALQAQALFQIDFESEQSPFAVSLPTPIEHYLVALRCAVGRIVFSGAYIKSAGVLGASTTIPIKSFPPTSFGISPFPISSPRKFSDENLRHADRYLALFSTSPNTRKVRQAIKRAYDAAERTNAEDAVVDYVVGLESLLTDKSRTETAFKLRMRLAYLIGKDSDDRVNVFNQMNKLYSVRSDIAHGQAERDDVASMQFLGEEYLRGLLIAVINLSAPLDLAALDLEILRGRA